MMRTVGVLLYLVALTGMPFWGYAQVRVGGKLVDEDGRALAFGHVLLYRCEADTPEQVIAVDTRGHFEFSLRPDLPVVAVFTAPGRIPAENILWLQRRERQVELEVMLPLLPVKAEPDSQVWISIRPRTTSSQRGRSWQWREDTAVQVRVGVEGTYSVELPASTPLWYKVRGVVEEEYETYHFPGESQHGYRLDTLRWDYSAVVQPEGGVARIHFRIPWGQNSSRKAPEFRQVRPSSVQLVIEAYEYWGKQARKLQELYQMFSDTLELLVRRAVQEVLTPLERRIDAATDMRARALYLRAYGEFAAALALLVPGDKEWVKKRFQQLLTEVPPTSPLWGLKYGAAPSMAAAAQILGEYNYLEQLLQRHPSGALRTGIMKELVDYVRLGLMGAEVRERFVELLGKYASPEVYEKAVAAAKLGIGKSVPDFTVPNAEDTTQSISLQSLRGKYVLLDFWATWCAPCVQELPYLQRAWERYRDRGLVIVSLSLDKSPDVVAQFRRKRFAMPWLHGWLRKGFREPVVQMFGVTALPFPILLDPEGKILAFGVQLRAGNLQRTLAQHLPQ